MTNRREFITLVGGAAAAPCVLATRDARAQRAERRPRIGVLMGFAAKDREAQTFQEAFSLRMKELGWIDGDTATFEYRWAAGDPAIFKAYAGELVALRPDVILANTSPATLKSAKVKPVTLPPGRARLLTMPCPSGSVTRRARRVPLQVER